MHKAQPGDRVRIQYSHVPGHGRPQKASVVKTCEFTVGGKEVFRSISLGVVGMATGDVKRLTLQPQEAYGAVRHKLIRQIPRSRLPQHIALKVGKRLTAFVAAAGQRKRVRVVEVTPDSVTVDGNHPLAGKVIELEVSLISLEAPSQATRPKPRVETGEKS